MSGLISGPIWGSFLGQFGALFGDRSGPRFEQKHKDTKGFGAFWDPLGGTFWFPFWYSSGLLFVVLAPFGAISGTLLGPILGTFGLISGSSDFQRYSKRFSKDLGPRKTFREGLKDF